MDAEQANRTISRQDWENKRRRYLIRLYQHYTAIVRNSRGHSPCKLEDYTAVSTKKGPCKICQKIRLFVRSPLETYQSVDLGPSEVVLSSPCTAHNHLITALLKDDDLPDIRHSPIKRFRVSKLAGSYAIHLSGDSGPHEPTIYAWNIRLLAGTNPVDIVAAREVYDNKIQISLLRRWKDRCDRCHDINCQQVSLQNSFIRGRPQWLIDTWTQCLVPGTQTSDYVALSYVWGNIAFFTTTQDNLERLRKPGAISLISLPKTIRDTLIFVEKLGERYCWIDSLCIVQDDRKAKYAEIENMSAIYANASFTVIAEGSSDAYSGLPGISTPRKFNQAIFQLGRGFKLAAQRNGLEHQNFLWTTRAWTFQEHLFSKRRMIFDTESVRWECSNGRWFEDVRLPDPHRTFGWHPDVGQETLYSNFPRSAGLVHLLRKYNTRNLTYEEDALNAFTGVMKALCRSFKHGFLSGLPLSFFDIALLWQSTGKGVRRICTKQKACLPSWSWAGWKCAIDSWSWIEWEAYEKADQRYSSSHQEVVIPLVHWSYHQVSTGNRVPIAPEWYDYRKKYFDSDACPPTGWTKHHIHEGSWEMESWPDMGLNPQQVPRCFYKHESDPIAEFWYPIPLPDASTISEPVNAPFISCHTRRGWLFGAQDSRPFHFSLATADGANIGYVCFLENENCGQNQGLQPDGPLELVEIARGYRTSLPRDDRDNPRYGLSAYYHVMWIEWKGNIAYRKGLGRVSEEAWNAENLEFIDLTLG